MTTETSTNWEELANQAVHELEMERGNHSALTSEEGYNGWSNRETWALNLHLSNDQGIDEATRETVAEAYKSHLLDTQFTGSDWTDEEMERIARSKTAETLRDWVMDELLDTEAGLLEADAIISILRDVGSLWRVNWEDVTDAYLTE